MAIHPRFAELILSGRKRVEFRKTRFTAAVTHVVIYATDPIQRVIGFFEVKGIDHAPPQELWRRHQRHGGIERKSFLAYYRERDQGVAIKVGEVFGLRKPRPLSSLGEDLVPPQSFRYLPPTIVDKLASAARKKPDPRSEERAVLSQ